MSAAASQYLKEKSLQNFSVEEMAGLLRRTVPTLGDQYKSADPDMVVSAYESFLLGVVSKTLRIHKKVLEQAAMRTFDGLLLPEAQLFSRQLANALVHCNYKKNRMSSGKKTHESVKRIVEAMTASDTTSTAATPKTSTASVKRTAAVSLPVSDSAAGSTQTAWELYGVSPPSKRQAQKKGYTPAVLVSSSEEEAMEISEKTNDLAQEKFSWSGSIRKHVA